MTFQQNHKDVHAVSDVSFGIPTGQIFGIAGYSGAGKSTLVRTINLLQQPTAGRISVLGEIFFLMLMTLNIQQLVPKNYDNSGEKLGWSFNITIY
nr:ATP-binding cassette domain-containing protein [Fructilactobacillus florum]